MRERKAFTLIELLERDESHLVLSAAASVMSRYDQPSERTLSLLLAGVGDKRYRYVRWRSIETLDQMLALHADKGEGPQRRYSAFGVPAKPWPAQRWNALKVRVEEARKGIAHEDAIVCHCPLCAAGHPPPHAERAPVNEHATAPAPAK